MAHKVIKTEHNGARHGRGPLTKQEVKVGSRKRRRVKWQKELKTSASFLIYEPIAS